MIDDQAFYLGSQNLYVANLAEWGILVDDKQTAQQVLDDYWNLVWGASYDDVSQEDRDVDFKVGTRDKMALAEQFSHSFAKCVFRRSVAFL